MKRCIKSCNVLPYLRCSSAYSDFIRYHVHNLGSAMVLGKLPVLGRPTNLNNSRARAAFSACRRCGCFSFLFF